MRGGKNDSIEQRQRVVLEALGAKGRNGKPRTTASRVLFFNESRGKAVDEVETKTERKKKIIKERERRGSVASIKVDSGKRERIK